jgi:hypothetical protein
MVASLDATLGYEEAFEKLTCKAPPPFQKWPDEDLADLIARNPDTAHARLAASEVRRREAWQTPARWSLLVSIAALLVSIVALARTF